MKALLHNLPLTHVGRSILRIRYRLLVIAMICASTFGVLVGAYSAIDSLFITVERIQSKADMADLELLFAPDDAKNLPDFAALPGVSAQAHRLVMSGQATLGAQGTVSSLLIAAQPELFGRINKLTVLDGRLPGADRVDEVALERNCAAHYGKRVGDRLNLRVGYVDYPLTVRGIVESPEYLIAPLNPSVYVPTNGSLCVMFGVETLLHDKLGFPAVNSVLLRLDGSRSAEAMKAAALELAQTRLSVDYALTRQEQFSQKFLELDLNTFKVFLPTVVLIFALSSILVVFFLMYQWIKEERPLIAMLLTLGYGRRQLIVAYLLPALAIVALALAMGLFLAGFDMWAFGSNYGRAIGMPEPTLRLQWSYIAGACALTVSTVGLGMFFPIRSMIRIAPIDALRDLNAQADHHPSWLIRAAQKVRGPFWLKYSLRNLIRSWQVSAVSILAVAASLAVTISFYVSLTSMERTAIGSVASDRWHAVVDLDAPLWMDEIGRLRDAIPASRWSPFVKGGAQVVSAHRSDNAYLLGIVPADKVRNVNLIAGRELQAGDGDAVILERRLAVDHQAAVGDTITLKVRGADYPARIVGIHSSAVPGEVVAPRAFAQRMLSLDDQFTGAFLVEPAPTARETAALYGVRGVVRVTGKDEIVAAILSISGHIWKIIHLSALMSIGVSALFVLTSITFTIMGRRGEYGMLRIIGHRNAMVTGIVLTEAALMAVIASLLAIPLGQVLGDVLNDRLTYVWFKVNTQSSVLDFLRVIGPALVLVPLAALPTIRNIFGIAPVDILKERKFG
ncbi:ABC transporter permease [Chitinimonas koreensis]|uniref:ABC transporter permease n=1 Tax=Chitinimonas koreensis TaxID=356302 RepID=UPI0003FF2EC0|nr:ABC transporter permease [Chitinimonas koreensis]QNM98211.1 ABC transporter permease [Chitinimonas koreensis]